MNLSKRLNRHINYHSVSGVLFSLLLGGYIVLTHYEDSLKKTIETIGLLKSQAVMVQQEQEQVERGIGVIKKALSSDFYIKSKRELLLLGLEEIKNYSRDARVEVTAFKKDADQIILPMSISSPLYRYRSLVNTIQHLQLMRFPSFFIHTITITTMPSESVTHYTIEGLLSVPTQKIKEVVARRAG